MEDNKWKGTKEPNNNRQDFFIIKKMITKIG